MKLTQIHLTGAYVIEPEPTFDERGFFARTWCREELRSHGLNIVIEQCSVSFNRKKGTLRGMHLQVAPHEEVKIVRCTQGAIYDVILDLRSNSQTYGKWFFAELSASNRKMLYVPAGFAHGFQALHDDTEVFYQISEPYSPECARGIRWNDPLFEFAWPISNPILSDRDRSFSDFSMGPEVGASRVES